MQSLSLSTYLHFPAIVRLCMIMRAADMDLCCFVTFAWVVLAAEENATLDISCSLFFRYL